MDLSERYCNFFLGISVVGWAVMGIIDSEPADRFTLVRLTISALNLLVGIFILVRMPVKQNGSPGLITAALPSLLTAGIAFKLSPVPSLWPVFAQILFAAGGSVAVVSFLFLGRSFAILPARRDVVVRGSYRLIRHPAYLGELVMVLACALAATTLLPWLPFLAAVPLVGIRILAEERLLAQDSAYTAYQKKVRHRLIPFIW